MFLKGHRKPRTQLSENGNSNRKKLCYLFIFLGVGFLFTLKLDSFFWGAAGLAGSLGSGDDISGFFLDKRAKPYTAIPRVATAADVPKQPTPEEGYRNDLLLKENCRTI